MGKDPVTPLLTFPCPYVLKVVALNSLNLAQLLTMVKPYVPEIVAADMTMKNSKQAKYVAFSVRFNAQSQQQLDALYQDLTAQKEIVFVL